MDFDHQLIIFALSDEKKPLMIKDIAMKCGINRHTVARKLDTLEILGRVRKIEIGNAKKFFLADTIPVSCLIDISNDLILVLNEKWEIQYINYSAQVLLNLTEQSVIGKRLDLLHLDFFSSPAIIGGLKDFSLQKVSKIEVSRKQNEIEQWYEISIMNLALRPGSRSIALIASNITEQLITKKKLIENEVMYRLLFEYAPIPIYEADYSQVKIYIDTLKKSGFTDLRLFFTTNPEEIKKCIRLIKIKNLNEKCKADFLTNKAENTNIIDNILPFFTNKTLDALIDLFISLDEGAVFYHFETSIINSDGITKFFINHISVASSFHDLSQIYISYLDITEQKLLHMEVVQKQKDLINVTEEVISHDTEIKAQISVLMTEQTGIKRMNTLYSHLLDAVNVPTIIWDSAHTIIWVSNAMNLLCGNSGIHLFGKQIDSLIPDEERDMYISRLSALTSTPNMSIEIPILHRSGTVKNVHWSCIEKTRTSEGKELYGAILREFGI